MNDQRYSGRDLRGFPVTLRPSDPKPGASLPGAETERPAVAVTLPVFATPRDSVEWYVDSSDPVTGDAWNTVERAPRLRGHAVRSRLDAERRADAVLAHLTRTHPDLYVAELRTDRTLTTEAREDHGLEGAVGYYAELRLAWTSSPTTRTNTPPGPSGGPWGAD